MIDIVILCPIQVEYMAVRQHILPVSSQKVLSTTLSYELGQITIKNKIWNIALFETGGNTGNVQAKTTQILSVLKPTYIFLVGIAAGIKDVEIGDLVIGTKAHGYEYGKETEQGFLTRPETVHYSTNLINYARQLIREQPAEDFKIEFGAIASGEKVINAKKGIIERIKSNYNDTKALEKESNGFALAAKEYDVSFLNIRGISDLAHHKKDDFQQLAAERAADFVLKLIGQLPKKKRLKPTQYIKVYHSKEIYSSQIWRKLKVAEIHFSDSLFFLKTEENLFPVSTIEQVEHLKMPGDFAKNWVKLILPNGKKIYLSEYSKFIGWRNIFGGSQQLFQQLKRFTINI